VSRARRPSWFVITLVMVKAAASWAVRATHVGFGGGGGGVFAEDVVAEGRGDYGGEHAE